MKATGHARQKELILAQRRAEAARLYLQGCSQAQIAERMGVHRSQITRDLAALRAEWRAKAADHTEEWVAEELARLAAVEAEAWAAWRRSQEDRQTVTVETDASGAEKTAKRTEELVGDAAMLGKILDCIKQRRELLGLDQPRRSELSGPAGGPIPVVRVDDLTDEQLARIAVGGSPGVAAEAASEVESSDFHDVHQAGIPGELAPPAPGGKAGPSGPGED